MAGDRQRAHRIRGVSAALAAAGALALLAGAADAQRGGGWTDRGWTDRGWTGPDDAMGPAMDRRMVPAPIDRLPPANGTGVRPAPILDYGRLEQPSSPFTGGYVRPYRGWTIPSYFVTSRFTVRDGAARGLASPGPGRQWVRYYDDAVLVGPGGRVDDVRYGLDWGQTPYRRAAPDQMAARDPVGRAPARRIDPRPMHGGGMVDDRANADRAYDDGYDDGFDDGHDAVAEHMTDRDASASGPYGYGYGTTVITTPGTITTTTTEFEEVVPRARVRTWRPAATRTRTKTWRAASPRWSR